jgi:hypothetical protein
VTVAALLAAMFVGTPGPTFASQACGNRSNYFDGFDTRDFTLYGAYGNINTRAGALCSGGTGASAAWTMVADNYFSGGGGYAQSGYASQTGNVTARYFSQYRKFSSNTPTTVWGGNASGTNLFITNYHFDTGHLYMYVNNTVLDHTAFDPAAGVWVGPWDGQYFGETWNPGDDMPGIAGTHVTFSTLRYDKCRSCGWVSIPTGHGAVTGSSRYHFSGSTAQFDIWTDPLS